MRHIKLVFVILHMPCGTCMNADRTFAIHDMLRQFGYLTDVSPRRFVVEQIVKALAHAPALKTVSIEWNDIAGWGNWEIKHLCLRPLERLMVHCVVESVNLALPPTMDHNFITHGHRRIEVRNCMELKERGLEKLGEYLTEFTGK